MNKEEWQKVAGKYEGFEIISDNGGIKPCAGCFGCWTKTPGECVIKDGYERMGALIHEAEEVVILTKYTYGGFSSFVKNVIDRSIGFVLPFFEIADGEMHHKARYPESKKITFIFRGKELSESDKALARRYTEAVCRNLKGEIGDVVFEECDDTQGKRTIYPASVIEEPKKTILLNCSQRGDNANSKKFLDKFATYLEGETQMVNLVNYSGKYEELLKVLLPAEKIVLGMPLYVDGIPSAPLRLMEMLEQCENAGNKHIYVVANMGFYESSQIKNLLAMVKNWCGKCGFTYGGGVAIGAGEMMGMMVAAPNIDNGPAQNIGAGFKALSEAVNSASAIEDFYADAHKFPRFLYMLAANSGWPRSGKINGLKKKDLYRCL